MILRCLGGFVFLAVWKPVYWDKRPSKLNIFPVHASHSEAMRFGMNVCRVSGIPSDSEVLETRGLVWTASLQLLGVRS